MEVSKGVLHVAEAGVLALLFLVVGRAWRVRAQDEGRELAIVVSAFLFAFAFEDVNVLTGTGRGSYFYNPAFALWLDRVPVFIVAAWAVILWSAMSLSDAAGGPLWARIARDGLFAVLLDIGFDAVAVRYRMWAWRGVSFSEAWFGVPAGNFFGWLWVSLAFSSLTRGLDAASLSSALVRRSRSLWQVLFVPLLALGLYKLVEAGTFAALTRLHCTSDRRSLSAFWGVLLLVAAIGYTTGERTVAPRLVWPVRSAFHAFAIIGVLLLPATPLLHVQRPALLAIASLLLAWEGWIAWRERKSQHE